MERVSAGRAAAGRVEARPLGDHRHGRGRRARAQPLPRSGTRSPPTRASSSAANDPANWACGVGDSSCSGWETFPILRWLLLAPRPRPFILSWIVIRGHALSWPRGELTAIVGLTAFVLIAYNGLDRQARRTASRSSLGYRLLARPAAPRSASSSRAASARWRAAAGRQRKPPATF